MMARHRIQAFLLRHVYEIWRSIDRKADILFFPLIDLLVFGFLTLYIEKLNLELGLAGAILGGVIFWNLVYNITRDIAFSLLDDAWSRNLYNLFSSPLKLSELITGMLILSLAKGLVTSTVVLALGYGLFHFNLFAIQGFAFFYLFNIFVFGWAFGFLTTSIILRFGTKAQAMAWSLILVLYPISGVYYPISILPSALAFVAKFFPISYIFTGLRDLIVSQTPPPGSDLVIIILLNSLYLIFGVWLFIKGLNNAKNRGWFIHPS